MRDAGFKPLVALLLLLGTVFPAAAAVILQYHHIGDETPVSTSVSEARFRQHLDVIQQQGFRVVALPELVARLRNGQAPGNNEVAISFDDAYSSVLTRAYPLLKARGWPFTVFVSTDAVDRGVKGVMTWAQLNSMAGVTLANHTRSHSHLIRRLPGESESLWQSRVRAELQHAEMRIQQQSGQAHKLLAYPYGEFDRPLLELVGAMGYAAVGQQSGAVGLQSDIRALPRFPFAGPYGAPEDFANKLNSLPLPVSGAWLRPESGQKRQPATFLLGAKDAKPELQLQLPVALAQKLSCFATGQGAIPVSVSARGAIVSLHSALPPGRSRINCTAPAAGGRFYWYSHPFVRPLPDGNWPEE